MDDVIIEGDNIYGTGVNIAARLEAACTPGQILMSSTVKDQVDNKDVLRGLVERGSEIPLAHRAIITLLFTGK